MEHQDESMRTLDIKLWKTDRDYYCLEKTYALG